jgi:hypothetical protein
MKHPKIPQTEVLEWLAHNYPALHQRAEIERDWVWLAVDLRGDHNKPTREAIKEYGFIFSRHSGHLLPSGKLGMCGHSCERPMGFGHGDSKQGDAAKTDAPTPAISEDSILTMFGPD